MVLSINSLCYMGISASIFDTSILLRKVILKGNYLVYDSYYIALKSCHFASALCILEIVRLLKKDMCCARVTLVVFGSCCFNAKHPSFCIYLM